MKVFLIILVLAFSMNYMIKLSADKKRVVYDSSYGAKIGFAFIAIRLIYVICVIGIIVNLF